MFSLGAPGCIPDSKAQEPDPGFPHKQNFPGFQNPDFLIWVYEDVSKQVNNTVFAAVYVLSSQPPVQNLSFLPHKLL